MRRNLVLLPLVLAACQGPPIHTSNDRFHDRLIATIPDGADVEVPIAFSRDGRHAAFVARTADGCRAVRGTWKSERLDAL